MIWLEPRLRWGNTLWLKVPDLFHGPKIISFKMEFQEEIFNRCIIFQSIDSPNFHFNILLDQRLSIKIVMVSSYTEPCLLIWAERRPCYPLGYWGILLKIKKLKFRVNLISCLIRCAHLCGCIQMFNVNGCVIPHQSVESFRNS